MIIYVSERGDEWLNANEKYYRRSYNAINNLIEVYQDGYDKERTLKFRQALRNKYYANPEVTQSEFNSIMFTAVTSLLGLNKEAIENTGKIIEYKQNVNSLKLDMKKMPNKEALRLQNFYNSKVISTDFDNWLSIKKNPNTDKNNIDYLKRIRNSLLHSNFYIDDDVISLPVTKLKTKCYYEADLLNLQFQMFVFEYFANIDALGLTEAMYTFDVLRRQIKDINMLIFYLCAIEINKITYKNLKTLGSESPELLLKESTNDNCEVNVLEFSNKLISSNNIDDLKCEILSLKFDYAKILSIYIDKKYGKNFYNLDYQTQSSILTTILKYQLSPKSEISNWITHFWYIYSSINNPNFNPKFFDGDEFGTESCYSSLMVLKSYLIMYRLQNNDFDEIDYTKIDFDIDDKSVFLYSENVDHTKAKENYFISSFNKEFGKGLINNEKAIWNKIFCEIIRDSLAHGNIRTFISTVDQKSMIEFKDVDVKKGTIRRVALPLSKYEEFLNSKAFLPSNCYKKDDSKILVKTI